MPGPANSPMHLLQIHLDFLLLAMALHKILILYTCQRYNMNYVKLYHTGMGHLPLVSSWKLMIQIFSNTYIDFELLGGVETVYQAESV